MKMTNRMYAYPVLSDENFDYKDAEFNVEMHKEMDGINVLSLDFDISLTSDYLNQLIIEDKAEFLIHLECSITSYRTIIKSSSPNIHKEIPIKELNGTLEMLAFVVLKENNVVLSTDEWEEDYEGMSFTLNKGSILAYQNLPELHITKDYEEFTSANSIFLVYKMVTQEEKPMEINLEANKIKVGLPAKDFQLYSKYSNKLGYQTILNSLIILPALVFMFEELKQEGGFERYKSRNWFTSLNRAYIKKGKNFEEEVLRQDKKSITLAQEIMDSPIAHSLDDMGNLTRTSVEEED